tara:strand:+ start:6099 stop:6761 length:663 start_codon:yes stop_codon:yes gene_type:complete
MSFEKAGLPDIDKIALLMNKILPKEIGYCLLKCGTLIMINPQSLKQLESSPESDDDPDADIDDKDVEEKVIFPNFDNWDYPQHRFTAQEHLEQVKGQNNEYLKSILDKNTLKSHYFQLALRYMEKVGYPHAGKPRSERKIDTPLPISGLCKTYGIDVEQLEGFKELVFCSWTNAPGIFNHYITKTGDPKLTADTASKILADLTRYDYIWPRLHSIRVPSQ